MPQENQNVLIYYLKEENPYSLENIAKKLGLPGDDGEGIAKSLIQKLREYKICSEVNDNNDKQYKFSFVGFLGFQKRPCFTPGGVSPGFRAPGPGRCEFIGPRCP